MDGGELAARCSPLQPYSEFDAARIARQVLSALAHLHSLRICHTDIKPENILFATRCAPPWDSGFACDLWYSSWCSPCTALMMHDVMLDHGRPLLSQPAASNTHASSTCNHLSGGLAMGPSHVNHASVHHLLSSTGPEAKPAHLRLG